MRCELQSLDGRLIGVVDLVDGVDIGHANVGLAARQVVLVRVANPAPKDEADTAPPKRRNR